VVVSADRRRSPGGLAGCRIVIARRVEFILSEAEGPAEAIPDQSKIASAPLRGSWQ
jgi:hypothetical protein